MKKILCIPLLFISSIYALDAGFIIGGSHFRYAEISSNNKDDLYILDSFDIGLSLNKPLGNFYTKLSCSAQLPYELTFKDAIGTDDYNYLTDMFYFGVNSTLSLGYYLAKSEDSDLSIELMANYDYFYFIELLTDESLEYIFSILGAGSQLKVGLPITERLKMTLNCAYIFNFLPLYNRGNEFLWSDNILLSASFIWSFKHE